MNLKIAPTVSFNQPIWFLGQGTVEIEDYVGLGYGLSMRSNYIMLQAREGNSVIHIGRGTILSNGVEIIACSKVSIGMEGRIGRCLIIDSDFHGLRPDNRDSGGLPAPVEIGNNVFIGTDVIILKGVHIGNGAVIGAGSVVTKDIPSRAIAAGNPARVIREV